MRKTRHCRACGLVSDDFRPIQFVPGNTAYEVQLTKEDAMQEKATRGALWSCPECSTIKFDRIEQ